MMCGGGGWGDDGRLCTSWQHGAADTNTTTTLGFGWSVLDLHDLLYIIRAHQGLDNAGRRELVAFQHGFQK